LAKQYQNLEKISFDYAVVEKAEKIVALTYSGSWKDLGTWNTLTEEMGTNQIEKGIISDDSSNTHLINELDIPVTVLGIKDAVVATSPDGILVTDKVASPRIKDILKGFEHRPMYEERR
jgi:mannose-1-phosphate guanylyltransferase